MPALVLAAAQQMHRPATVRRQTQSTETAARRRMFQRVPAPTQPSNTAGKTKVLTASRANFDNSPRGPQRKLRPIVFFNPSGCESTALIQYPEFRISAYRISIIMYCCFLPRELSH